ncbi:MAG: hypothetical protein H0T42_05680 [Deltaproteobacteria bacterium]|nr:hypothetical protein [Deltaproteobacteria bacterium]
MSGRVLVIDGDRSHDVFEVIGIAGGIARVRSALLFEVGEELAVRIEHEGAVTETTVRVRAHVGPADSRITELEMIDDKANK